MNKIKEIFSSEITLLDIENNKLAFVFGCIALSPLIGFIPSITPIYYTMLIVAVLVLIKSVQKLNTIALLFITVCALSIILAFPPSFFKSWFRLGLFTLVFILASPLLQSNKARKFRQSTLQLILFVSVIVALLSFVFYFIGINYMVYLNSNEFMESYGRFGGLTRHSMLLGPISAIATIYCVFRALSTNNKIYWLLSIPCVACIMFSASRSAFSSAIIGVLIMMYANSKNNFSFIRKVLPIATILIITFPLWEGALSGLEEKQQRNIDKGSAYSSRSEKWNNRFEEFTDSPLWGVGFCACAPEHNKDYEKATGVIESGSSWLAILSMTGIFGMVPFLIMSYTSINNVWRKRKTNQRAILYIGLISFLFTHMIAEGYILAGGSILCIISWFIITCCYET